MHSGSKLTPKRANHRSADGRAGLIFKVLMIVMLAIILILAICIVMLIKPDEVVQSSPPLPTATPPSAEINIRDEVPDNTSHFIAPSGQDWNLVLVNPWNYVPEGHSITLTALRNDQSVDERIYPDLQQMMDDARAAGLEPLICSSYRSQEKQISLFNEEMLKYTSQGYSEEAAREKVRLTVAVAGTSEHQLGLAVDIVSMSNQMLDSSQESTPEQQWLMQNSYKYGFILRYPSGKSDITGIRYEPWHYRYVGKEAAQEIYSRGICLEEYLMQLYS